MNVDDQAADGIAHSAEVFDFLDAYFEDLEAGFDHPLEHYLERFPGREEMISREYLAQREGGTGAPGFAANAALSLELERDSLVGPYRLLSEIGRGGQGVVYLAEDTRIARRVALKVLPPAALLLSEDRRRRLRREAEVISRLAHPGICGIFDAEIEQDLAYIAMPFVEGRTLASLLAERRDETHRAESDVAKISVRPATEAELFRLLELFERAARALHSAHEAGVVHRDIKPANLMVTPKGDPIWLDFGQARDSESQMVDLTLSGEIFGTPAYMSPEQVAGRPSDARTDVWALGVSLFEALTLRRPFEGRSVHSLLLAVQMDEVPDAHSLNPIIGAELKVVLATALERDITRRYASALAFAEDLARLRSREAIRAVAPGHALRFRRWVQRHPVQFVASLSISIGLLVSTTLLVQKDEALRFALGRHLAARSEALLAEDPASALILGIQAVERAPNYLTRGALFRALEACQLRTVYEASDYASEQSRFRDVGLVPGGQFVAAVRFDGEGRLYDLLSGELRQTWKAHQSIEGDKQPAGLALACAASGAYVATGGSDGRVHVRDIANARTLVSFEGLGGAVTALGFGADDATVFARCASGGLGFYRATSGELLSSFNEDALYPIHWDGSAARFVEAPGPGAVPANLREWDAQGELVASPWTVAADLNTWIGRTPNGWLGLGARGELRKQSLAPTDVPLENVVSEGESVLLARVSPQGHYLLLIVSKANVVRTLLVDLESWSVNEWSMNLDGAPEDCAFSPSDERLAVITTDGMMRVWDVRSKALVATCRGYLNPHTVRWSADSAYMLTRRDTGPMARLWYGTERPDVYTLRAGNSPVKHVEFAPNGEHALTVSKSGRARLWSTPSKPEHGTQTGACLLALGELPGEPSFQGAHFSSDGVHFLATAAGVAQLWRTQGPQLEQEFKSPAGPLRAQLSPQGALVLAWTEPDAQKEGSAVRVMEMRTLAGEIQWRVQSVGEELLDLRFTPNGTHLMSSDTGGVLRCIDAATGAVTWSVTEPSDKVVVDSPSIVDMAFSPDSKVVAVARSDRRIRFYLIADHSSPRKDIAVFPPEHLDWSVDGRRLLVTGSKGRGALRVEDLTPPTPEENVLRAEFFHASDLTGGVFSPDGTLALTTSLDGTIMVRDVSGREDSRSMTLVAHLQALNGAVESACFSGGAGPLRVLAGFADGYARVWPVDPLPAAKARQPREDLQDWEAARETRFALPLRYP